MVWYSGSIPEAIAESRKLSKIFVVYITGDDEESKRMDEMWNDENIQNICNSMCVALRLEADSEGCKQFSAIYPVLKFPSGHFIDNNGKVLDVIYAQSTLDDFLKRIQKVVQTNSSSGSSSQSADTSSASGQPPEETDANILQQPTSQRSAEEIAAETKRLQEKIKEKRDKEKAEKDEEAKLKEVERRELGRNLQKLKEAQQEAKMKQDIEERRKDKLEERAAKERVKRQIEQDKLDRAARFQQEKLERDQANAKKQSEIKIKDEEEQNEERKQKESKARIQFRLPDGSTSVQQFESMDLLLSAFSFVVSLNYPLFPTIKSFDLATTFPKKIFSESERNKSFAELGLSPSASLAVLPRQNKGSSSDLSPASSILSLIMYILLIPSKIIVLLWSFISGRSNDEQQRVASSSSPNHDNSSSNNRIWSDDGELRRRTGGQSSSMEAKRHGKMTRLTDVKRDGDDDEATWNGNSTQQM